MIVLFVGHSGCGKNTLIKELIKNFTNTYDYIVSTTSREIREYDGEVEGNPYRFIKKETFKEKIDNKEFLEFEEIHGNYYGLDIDTIEGILASNEHKIYLKDIGVLGAVKLKELYGDKILTVFIDVENLDLIKERLVMRGTSEEEIQLRMKRVSFEREFITSMDKYVVNNDLEMVVTGLDLDFISYFSENN